MALSPREEWSSTGVSELGHGWATLHGEGFCLLALWLRAPWPDHMGPPATPTPTSASGCFMLLAQMASRLTPWDRGLLRPFSIAQAHTFPPHPWEPGGSSSGAVGLLCLKPFLPPSPS